MRGLKLFAHPLSGMSKKVASFTDAWIETYTRAGQTNILESHLLQMRGLKLARAQEFFRNAVASFTDAWIETLRYLACGEYGSVASFTDAWIETMIINILYYIQSSHLLQMRGLKHFYWFRVRASIGRIFYRCVD